MSISLDHLTLKLERKRCVRASIGPDHRHGLLQQRTSEKRIIIDSLVLLPPLINHCTHPRGVIFLKCRLSRLLDDFGMCELLGTVLDYSARNSCVCPGHSMANRG